MPDTHNKLQ